MLLTIPGDKKECDTRWKEITDRQNELTLFNSWKKLVTLVNQPWETAPLVDGLRACLESKSLDGYAPDAEWLEKFVVDVQSKKSKLEELEAPWLKFTYGSPQEPTEEKELEAFKETKSRYG